MYIVHFNVLHLNNVHQNFNGLTVHDYLKISLLPAYITHHNYDIIRLSETFLNSSIETSDDRISIEINIKFQYKILY